MALLRFGILLLVVCFIQHLCLCEGQEVKKADDPNYTQEFTRITHASLRVALLVGGVHESRCGVVGNTIKVLQSYFPFSLQVLLEDGTCSMSLLASQLKGTVIIPYSKEKVDELDSDDLDIFISIMKHPIRKSSRAKLVNIHISIFDHSWSDSDFRMLLRGYDVLLHDGDARIEGQVKANISNIIALDQTLMPIIIETLDPNEVSSVVNNTIIEGILSSPFSNFVRNNIKGMRAMSTSKYLTSNKRSNVALIVEPRVHPQFEFVVRSTLHHLNKNVTIDENYWKLQIHYMPGTNGNENFVRKALSDISPALLELIPLTGWEGGSSSYMSYNRLLKSKDLWDLFKTQMVDRVLIFQSDSLLIRTDVTAFYQFDYVGAPWHLTPGAASSAYWRDMAKKGARATVHEACCNGGLSLRRVDAMLKISHSRRSANHRVNEDLYFSRSAKDLGLKLPSRAQAYGFAREIPCSDIDSKNEVPFALHNNWAYVDERHSKALFKESQEVIGEEYIE